MNKTYGGSIIKLEEQTDETRQKFKEFLANMKIDEANFDKYRVFVPYNI